MITVEQCMYGILVASANEAANALAEHISGSMEEFVKLMNQRAAELGCENSHFVTTNGLHDDQHYTSPYDLALIARKFFDNELLCKMSSTPTYHIPQSPTQPDDDLYANTHNKLLFPGGKYNYEYLVGSKTGFTQDSRQTLVSCAEKDGMKLICVVMREETPHQFDDTISLFEYGFSNFQKLNIAANEKEYTVENHDFFQTDNDVFGASNPILSINPSDSVVIPITAVFDDLDSEITYDTESSSSVASIQYTYHGIPVGSATVDLAEGEVESSFDFEDQMESVGNETEEVAENTEAPDDRVVFVNVRVVIAWVIGVAGFLILLFVVKAVIDNYQFAQRRKVRNRHKKRRKFPSEFDDYDF